MKGRFGKKDRATRALVFVDFEYWYYSYRTIYHIKPDISAWYENLKSKYDIMDIMIFGDFSSGEIGQELVNLRHVTNHIIETGNTYQYRKKDMTDYIYQSADTDKNTGTYILFTGDGHFHSVVRYLCEKRKKHVVVYGVTNSFSRHLQAAASETVFMPADNEATKSYYRMIVSNLENLAGKPGVIPTFMSTVDAVSSHNNVPRETIQAALSKMIDLGYIYKKDYLVAFRQKVKIIAVNWELAARDGLRTAHR